MAGKSNTSATYFAQKKLLGKANTSLLKSDGEELIGSNIQAASSLVFGQTLPDSPSQTLYLLQSASNGGPATVEYIHFALNVLTGTTYNASDSGLGAGSDSGEASQSSGPHTYKFTFRSDYESNSSNTKKGKGNFDNGKIVHETLGKTQLIPPFFSQTAPNPYIVEIYKDNGSGGIGDKINLTDNIDWNVDFYNGILFLQDYDAAKIPAHAKAFAYVGDFADQGFFENSLSGSLTQLTDGSSYLIAGSNVTISSASNGQVTINSTGGGSARTVAGDTDNGLMTWVTSDNTFSAESNLLFDGSTLTVTGDSSLNGSVIINESGADKDFRIESSNKQNAIFVDGGTDQVLILSGGSATSYNEPSGLDVNFYVSGSIDSRGTSVSGTSVFGGDIYASGSIAATKLSGSLTQLTDGSSYLVAGNNVTITTASNGQVTIASTNVSPDGSDTQVQFNDGGSFGGDSGLVFNKTTNTLTATNISGSLTRLSNGSSYIAAGDNITITSGSNGQITISSTASAAAGSSGPRNKKAYQVTTTIDSGSSFTTSNSNYSNAGYDPSLIDIFLNGQLLLSGTDSQVGTGNVDYFVSNTTQLKFGFDLQSDDIVNVIVASTGSEEAGNPGGTNTQVQFNDGGSLSGDSGLVFNKTTNTLTATNISGSLTRLSDGTSYIIASNNITITSQSNGSVLIAAPNSIFNEYIGEANGSNTRFTLDKVPTANKNVSVFVNGQLHMPATDITGAPFQDFSVTGSVIYFVTASLPPVGSFLMANYTTNQRLS